jgi:hypothetical protein
MVLKIRSPLLRGTFSLQKASQTSERVNFSSFLEHPMHHAAAVVVAVPIRLEISVDYFANFG